MIACRSEPAPVSALFVTVKVAGTHRSSSASNRNRHGQRLARCCALEKRRFLTGLRENRSYNVMGSTLRKNGKRFAAHNPGGRNGAAAVFASA
jgi:hypothetical protein